MGIYTVVFWFIVIMIFACGTGMLGLILKRFMNERAGKRKGKDVIEETKDKQPEIQEDVENEKSE